MCQAKRNGGSLVDREQALEAWGRGEQPPGENGERGTEKDADVCF